MYPNDNIFWYGGTMRQMTHQGQLGNAIRVARRSQGLTQQQLADKAGVGRVWLSQAERGKPTVQIREVFKVLKALGKSLTIDDEPEDLLALVLGDDYKQR